MLITKIENVLAPLQLAKVRAAVTSSSFIDGRVSGGSLESKHNLEMTPSEDHYIEVLNIIETAVRENAEFNMTAFPRYLTRPIISRYDVGMFYKDHVDMPVMGFMSQSRAAGKSFSALGHNYVRSDLSMTLFLNDPSTYDGGELSFEGSLEPLRIKLNAGSAIVYPTGSWHRVRPVTRGSRLAAIFWIQSMFPAEAHRQAVCDARRLYEALKEKEPDSTNAALAEASFFNLCRLFASV